jgi:hypothetical protein
MNENKIILWVVGRYKGTKDLEVIWDFQGIFELEDDAVKACRDRTYFVAPAKLNVSLPHETFEWVGVYYPETSEWVGEKIE